MTQSASRYPISQVITRLMHNHGYSPVEFVQSLGYRNVERGLRRLEPWLLEGHGFERILGQIAAAYPSEAHALGSAITDTANLKKADREAAMLESCRAQAARFVPYVHVEGEVTVPNGITLFGMTGGKSNLIELSQMILDVPLEKQLTALPDLMQDYLIKFRGACPFFGKVTGFRFVRLIDYYQFDSECVLVGHVDKPFRRGVASVTLR